MNDLLTHPDQQEMDAFALGTLEDSRYPEIEEHLAECLTCQEYASLVPGDTFVSMLASSKTTMEEKRLLPVINPIEPPAELSAHSRYKPSRLLGVGGMGTVWLAEHSVMGRQVAIKVIRPEFLAKPGAVGRFRREVAAAAKLHHPNIVTAFDAEQAGNTHFLAMEYIDGIGLDDLLKEKGALPVVDACRFIAEAARGLDHAHRLNLVHRDVKPSNLMLSADGTVKILDFGLAMIVADDRADTTITGANMVVGTPDYIAPEQAEHPQAADCRADIYALGCSFYQLLTGQVPFPGVSVLQKLDSQRRDRPKPISAFRSDVPFELSAIVVKMLAKKPADRYPSAAEVAAALTPFTDPAYVAKKNRPRYRRFAAIAACFLFLALVAGGVVYRIKTDKGELVITTNNEDVEVIVKKNGELITIIDTKTQNKVELKSGEYELELKGAQGLKLDISKATLTRGKETLATIERVTQTTSSKDPDAKVIEGSSAKSADAKVMNWPPKPLPEKPGFMVRLDIRFADSSKKLIFSPDNKLIAVHNPNNDISIIETATGKIVTDDIYNGMAAIAFTSDPKNIGLVAAYDRNQGLYEFKQLKIEVGKHLEWTTLIPTVRLQAPVTGLIPSPDMKHLIVETSTPLSAGRGMPGRLDERAGSGRVVSSFITFDVAKGVIVQQIQNISGRALVSRDRSRLYSTSTGFEQIPTQSGPGATRRVSYLHLDNLTTSVDRVEVEIPDNARFLFESEDGAKIGFLCKTKEGKEVVTALDARTLKKVGNLEIAANEIIDPSMIAKRRPIAIAQKNSTYYSYDLARTPPDPSKIASIPNQDALILSDDGQVFGARTETGWNLYRLPAENVTEKNPGVLPGPGVAPSKDAPAVSWPPKPLPEKPGLIGRLPIEWAKDNLGYALSPDGRLMAFYQPAVSPTVIHIVESATGKTLAERSINSKVVAVQFISDAAKLVIAKNHDPNIFDFVGWDLASNSVSEFMSSLRLEGGIDSFIFSADNSKIAIDQNGRKQILDVKSGKVLASIMEPETISSSVLFTADGTKAIATVYIRGNPDSDLLIVEDFTEKRLSFRQPLEKSGRAFEVPGSNRIGLHGDDSKIIYYDLGTRKLSDGVPVSSDAIKWFIVAKAAPRGIFKRKNNTFGVFDLTGKSEPEPVAFTTDAHPNSDDHTLSDDGRVFAVRAETGWNLYRLPAVKGMEKGTVSPQTPKIPTTGFQLPEKPTETKPKESQPPPKKIEEKAGFLYKLPRSDLKETLRFSADGSRVGLIDSNGRLEISTDHTGNNIETLQFERIVHDWCFLPDGGILVAVDDLPTAPAKTLRYSSTLKPVPFQLATNAFAPMQLMATPDGEFIVVRSANYLNYLDAKTGEPIYLDPKTRKGILLTNLQAEGIDYWRSFLSADGKRVYSFGDNRAQFGNQSDPNRKTVFRIDTIKNSPSPSTTTGDLEADAIDIMEMPGGDQFAVLHALSSEGCGKVEFRDRRTGKVVAVSHSMTDATVMAGGRLVVLSPISKVDNCYRLLVNDPSIENGYRRFALLQEKPQRLEMSPNGRYLAAAVGNVWQIYRLPEKGQDIFKDVEQLPLPRVKE